jgi:ribose transport system ATP-binding protein
MGREPRGFFKQIDTKAVRREAVEALDKLGAGHIHPDRYVSDLSLADRQLVEIARAVAHETKVLILDEPTSALNTQEVSQLFHQIRLLRAKGVLVIFISHKLDEIRQIADRVTVFRDGSDVGTLTDFDESKIVALTLGRELTSMRGSFSKGSAIGSTIISVKNLNVEDKLSNISFDLHEGQILGLAGLEGQGQSDLMLSLFGNDRRGLSGEISMGNRKLHLKSPRDAVRAGIALIPEDRKTQGLFTSLSIATNISVAFLFNRMFASLFGYILARKERTRVTKLMEENGIKASGPDQIVNRLSGGNQQKVVLAKWLLTEAKVYLLFDPTRGIDVGAKVQFYQAIRGLADGGNGVILYSTEVDELVMLCDRVLVMDGGRIVGQLEKEELTPGNITQKWLNQSGVTS